MARPRLRLRPRLRIPRFHTHAPAEACYVIRHLDLDGTPLCPEGKRLHSPSFWTRFRLKCRNLRDHEAGYVIHQECMWCRWLLDEWERTHLNVAEQYPEPGFATERQDLQLMSPMIWQLEADPAHNAFLKATREELAST